MEDGTGIMAKLSVCRNCAILTDSKIMTWTGRSASYRGDSFSRLGLKSGVVGGRGGGGWEQNPLWQ